MAPPRQDRSGESNVPEVSAEGRAMWHQEIAEKVQRKLNAKSRNMDWGDRLEAAAEAGAIMQQQDAARSPEKVKKTKKHKAKHKKHKHHKHKSSSSSDSLSDSDAEAKRKKRKKRSPSVSSDSESDHKHKKKSKKSKHKHHH